MARQSGLQLYFGLVPHAGRYFAFFESWDWYFPGVQLTAEDCGWCDHDVSLLVFLVVGLPCCRDVFLVVIGLPDCRGS